MHVDVSCGIVAAKKDLKRIYYKISTLKCMTPFCDHKLQGYLQPTLSVVHVWVTCYVYCFVYSIILIVNSPTNAKVQQHIFFKAPNTMFYTILTLFCIVLTWSISSIIKHYNRHPIHWFYKIKTMQFRNDFQIRGLFWN